MVGRFVEKKGHEYGLRAFARARRGGLNARLVIAGDGPLRGRYERLIAELGLGGSVELPGALPHEKIGALLAAAAVVLTPSVVARTGDREGGLTFAKEASACAVPIVGTHHGGIVEIIDDGATGYLVAERDAEALGDRLCAILRDPALGEPPRRRRAGENGAGVRHREAGAGSRGDLRRSDHWLIRIRPV